MVAAEHTTTTTTTTNNNNMLNKRLRRNSSNGSNGSKRRRPPLRFGPLGVSAVGLTAYCVVVASSSSWQQDSGGYGRQNEEAAPSWRFLRDNKNGETALNAAAQKAPSAAGAHDRNDDKTRRILLPQTLLPREGATLQFDTANAAAAAAAAASFSNCADGMSWLSIDEARGILAEAYATAIPAKYFAMPGNKKNNHNNTTTKINIGGIYTILGQRLLQAAAARQKRLVTLQIGANDGLSNDAFYEMFAPPHAGARRLARNRHDIRPLLPHWMPVVVEPVPENFDALQRNYAGIPNLTCAQPVPWAISYEQRLEPQHQHNDDDGRARQASSSSSSSLNTCTFYRFNVADTAPLKCRNKPEWLRTQIGTLLKEHIEWRKSFDQCIVPQEVPCGTVGQLMEHVWGKQRAQSILSSSTTSSSSGNDIVWWQLDTEGYESVLLPAMLQEFSNYGNVGYNHNNNVRDNSKFPAMIQYESRVLQVQDRNQGTTRLTDIRNMLRQAGYIVLEGNMAEDLALRIANMVTTTTTSL